MSYKIVAQYYKDISFEIPDAKTALLLEKDIKNYRFVCDINSEKVKENIIEVGVNLKLSPIEKSTDKIIYVSVNLASLITIEAKVAKEELEKIILIEIPTRIYPNLRSMVVLLFEKSGYKKISIHEKIDFLKLYEQKKNQKWFFFNSLFKKLVWLAISLGEGLTTIFEYLLFLIFSSFEKKSELLESWKIKVGSFSPIRLI